MPTIMRLAVATMFCALSLVPAVAAGPRVTPVGWWQSADGQARVRVTMCGDGTQLCARLVGLTGDARNAKNLQLLNSYVVDRALRADDNVWEGVVHFNGQTATGHITLVSAGMISVSGCQMGMCRTFQFTRVSKRMAAANTVAAAPAETLPQMPPRTVGLTFSE